MPKTVLFTGDQISKQPQALYEKFLQPLADKWDIDIVVISCHGRYEVVPTELPFDKLYIFAQLLPKEFDEIKKATTKGYKVNGEMLTFPVKIDPKNPSASPCPQGDTLVFGKAPARAHQIKDDDNQVMAIILDGSVYFLNDFIHSRGKDDFTVGVKELELVLKHAVDNCGLLHSLKHGVEEKSKRALEAALRIQFTTRLDKEQLQMKACKDTMTQYEKGIVEAMRKIMAGDKILDAIRKNIEDVPVALDKTWKNIDKMRGSKGYTSISFTNSGIKAITTPVVILYDRQEYDMGRYEVNLGFDGSCKIFALDRKIEQIDHPHVNAGNVCWGNFSGWIPKLIGSSEFDVALDQVYTFLCNYDSASPYKNISFWPKVVKPVAKAAAKVEEVKVAQTSVMEGLL